MQRYSTDALENDFFSAADVAERAELHAAPEDEVRAASERAQWFVLSLLSGALVLLLMLAQ